MNDPSLHFLKEDLFLESCQTSMKELLVEIVNSFKTEVPII